VSDWITYDEFVDLVRNHHHDGFTGLITGVNQQQHAFKLGFDQGQIALITYRILKGQPALELLAQIKQAKITQYPTSSTQYSAGGMPDTASVLSQLTGNTLDDTTVTNIEAVPELESADDAYGENIDSVMRKNIEVAAVHHFGPMGALVCDELLEDFRGDLRTAVFEIAQEVGASETDTRAFFETISSS
jgi:hypothetical protein